ncbi:head GIN domain-containing protein [uncultured Pontibacter sp.]|uniref:head GIN domain-containing protein n=1 Tax=uncultured Pontibacter sp. TaxID=453356 RepID=UPI0026306B59|nr:head GIN domain-containing protein [uncultured Pontibacter sp.]
MKFLKIPAAFFALLCLSACDESGPCLSGEGDVEARTIDIGSFEGVKVQGSTKVYIQRGNRQKVEVKGQPNILDELETNVESGVWEIGFDRCLRNHETVEVYITVPELNLATVSGSGYIELEDRFRAREFEAAVSGSGDIKGRVDAENLTARISGSGTIDLAGAAREQDVRISGSGSYYAYDLRSERAEVNISGSGKAQVKASDKLDAGISGSGRVYYKGNPETNSTVSGSGKLIKD